MEKTIIFSRLFPERQSNQIPIWLGLSGYRSASSSFCSISMETVLECVTAFASACTLEFSKISVTVSSTPNCCRIIAINRITVMELPPKSKKSSSAATSESSRICANISEIWHSLLFIDSFDAASLCLCFCCCSASAVRYFLSTFPFAVSLISGIRMIEAGIS